jgi:hypothetical protein
LPKSTFCRKLHLEHRKAARRPTAPAPLSFGSPGIDGTTHPTITPNDLASSDIEPPPNTQNSNPSKMAARGFNALYKYAVPGAVAASLAQNSIYDVKGGTRAVIFDRISGVKETVVNEGTHFLVPWLQKAIIFDVRTKPRTIGTTTGSKDMQMVSLTLRVLHRPDVQALPKIYQVGLPSLVSCGAPC